jgi:phosphoribosylamine--glycine ligase
MKVLVLGSGAKDHAITYLFSQSKLIVDLFVAKGNVGTAAIAKNLPEVDPSSPESVYNACLKHDINFVFIGTEDPLLTGVIDYLNSRGIDTFGAPKNALKLEDDRYFARTFTARHNIPTPPYRLFSDESSLSNYLKRHPNQNFVYCFCNWLRVGSIFISPSFWSSLWSKSFNYYFSSWNVHSDCE